MINAFSGRNMAGALAIGKGSAQACLAIVHACSGSKFVSIATPPVSFDTVQSGSRRNLSLLPILPRLLAANVSMAVKSRLWGIRTKFIFGSALAENEVGPLIYADFLPKALAEGRYKAAPDPIVTGTGLAAIKPALAA